MRVGPFRLQQRLDVELGVERWLAVNHAHVDGEPVELMHAASALAHDEEMIDALEAKIAARGAFAHPSVPALVDTGRDDRVGLWWATSYTPRVTLDELVHAAAGGLALPLAVTVIHALAGVLVERARLPAPPAWPIPLRGDTVAVTRAGAVQLLRIDDGLERRGLAGSGARAHVYRGFAPEQAGGAAVTPTTPVFALGSLLWELVVGAHPFRASSSVETLRRIHRGAVVDEIHAALVDQRPDIPDAVALLVARMHTRDPRERIGAAEVVDVIERDLAWAQWSPELVAREVRALVPH